MDSNNKESFHSRAKKLITRVGDQDPEFYKRDILKLGDEILNNFSNESAENKELLIKHFVECIGLLNQKGGIYATVITLIDLKSPNFAENIIDKVLENLQKGLDAGDLIIPKYSLIFLGELMNIGLVNSFSFITLLYDLVNEAEKTLKQSFDYYLHIVINVFPYLIDGLSEKSGLEFKSLIDNIQEIMKKRQKQQLCLLRHFVNKEYDDNLTLLWSHLFEIMNKGGSGFKIIMKPYLEFKEEFKNIKQIKKNKKIYFNNKNQKACVYFSPEKIPFNEEEIIKEGSNPNFLERLLIFENLTEIFSLFRQNSKFLSQRLLHFHCPYPYIPILVEVLFSEMLRLPQTNKKPIFYFSLAVFLANEGKEEFKTEFQSLVFQIVDSLFKKLEILDLSLSERLLKFLSFYLGNNKAAWEWKKWEFVKEENSNSPRKNFLIHLFQKLILLLNRKTVEEELPTVLHDFMPSEKLYKLKYSETPDAQIIMDKFHSKVTDKELEDFLNNPELNKIEATGDFFIETFLECFLMKTSQSLTHLKIIIDRYRNFLTSLLPSVKETSQATAINSIQEFWANSEWHLSIYIQTFFEYKLLKSSVIINWVFKNLDKATINPFEESCFWGILESLLEKTSTKIQFFSEEMKKDPKNENIMEIEKFLGQEREENKNLLLLVFKKICLLLSECAQTQRSKFETLLQRFISLIRNYRNELDSIYERLDEDFFLLSNIPEMNKMIPYFKLLT